MSLIPAGVDNPAATRVAKVNLTLIVLNFIVFGIELLAGDTFIEAWAFVPARLTAFLQGHDSPQVILTLFTALFMHGGLDHILGNMLFLWIFGASIEAVFGERPYLTFYLASGLVGNLAQFLAMPNSTVPLIGASGAIAGVMGAYLALYPTSRVQILVWPLSLFTGLRLQVSAWLMLGLWFASQLVMGLGETGAVGDQGGIGYWAHAGGFAFGFVLALLIRPSAARGAEYSQ